ncbi:GATA-4/5/6 transcription factors [Phaffia rhodozyma]|uniref:GATA-4/5/6 transcription factors n=1 Tax=Phaffia rhodozyma TaxID=264483 RepID=A0A0F7SRL1_PHARH|nr:GATA-4/5/6 transcription factors [Phaffia rhodozyma]
MFPNPYPSQHLYHPYPPSHVRPRSNGVQSHGQAFSHSYSQPYLQPPLHPLYQSPSQTAFQTEPHPAPGHPFYHHSVSTLSKPEGQAFQPAAAAHATTQARNTYPPIIKPETTVPVDMSAMGRVLRDDEPYNVPEVGQIRCYFLYLGPTLQFHMGTEHMSMIGTSIFDYLHPEEVKQGMKDLRGVVSIGNLSGTVTRVKFASVPLARQLLGCTNPEQPKDGHYFLLEDNYLALDLVLNVAGDGIVLAFFHASVDKDPTLDIDKEIKSDWSNWCGTSFIRESMVKHLWNAMESLPVCQNPTPGVPAFPPTRVFQILLASPDHDILFSHPPPRHPDSDRSIVHLDGSYFEEDFQRLLHEISLDLDSAPMSDAKTTCTKRFRAQHTLATEGCLRHIESVFIPYGTLIFCCFQTIQQQFHTPTNFIFKPLSAPHSRPFAQDAYLNSSLPTPQRSPGPSLGQEPMYRTDPEPDRPSSRAHLPIGLSGFPTDPILPIAAYPGEPNGLSDRSGFGYGVVTQGHRGTQPLSSSLSTLSQAPLLPPLGTVAPSIAPPLFPFNPKPTITDVPSATTSSLMVPNPSLPSPIDSPSKETRPPIRPPPSDGYHQANFDGSSTSTPVPTTQPEDQRKDKTKPRHKRKSDMTNSPSSSSSSSLLAPPSISLISKRAPHKGGLGGGSVASSGAPKAAKDLRNEGRPPRGVDKCASCGLTESPEWRKGETGLKDLCNACGLRYARLLAKRSGKLRARGKKQASQSNGQSWDVPKKKLRPDAFRPGVEAGHTENYQTNPSSNQRTMF